MNLKMKGINEKLIAKSMDEIDDSDYEETLKKLYQNYFLTQKGLKEYQKKSKTIRHLMSKGYEYEVILDVMKDEE